MIISFILLLLIIVAIIYINDTSHYYLYEWQPNKIIKFKPITKYTSHWYVKYLNPERVQNKTSSLMAWQIQNQCFDTKNPNHMVKLFYRLIKNDPKYKKDPCKWSQIIYKWLWQQDKECQKVIYKEFNQIKIFMDRWKLK